MLAREEGRLGEPAVSAGDHMLAGGEVHQALATV